jgi:hypothetical protein
MARVDVEFHGVSGSAVSASRSARDGIAEVGKAARTNSSHVAGLGRSAHDAEREIGRLSRGALSGSGLMRNFGRSIAFASGSFLGAAGFIALVRQSVGEASSLSGEIARSRSEFGKSSRGVLEWSKTTSSSLGIARSDALKFANAFGQIFAPLQLGQRRTADMSRQLVILAGDLATVNNTTSDRTFDALTSGLTGRVRALREFGILLNEDRVKAEALSMGLVHATADQGKVADAQRRVSIATAELAHARSKYGENTTQVASAEGRLESAERTLHKAVAGHVPTLTAAQHALATYNLVMQQSSGVHREAEKRAGSLTAQQQKLRAELKEQEGVLGAALLPTLVQVVTASADWLGKTRNQERVQRALRTAVADVKEVLAATWPIVKTLAHHLDSVAKSVGGWGNAFKIVLSGLLVVKIAKVAASIRDLALAARVASGEKGVAGLIGWLTRLSNFGPISIPIGFAVADLAAVLSSAGDSGGPSKTSTGVGTRSAFDWLKSGDASRNKAFRTWLDAFLKTHSKLDDQLTPTQLWNSSPEFRKAVTAWYKAKIAPTGMSAKQAGNTIVGTAIHAAQTPGASSTSFHLAGEASPYDCSAFAQAVFAHNGIRIGRNTYAQIAGGRKVAINDLQPGDLVFFNYGGERWPGHVAIYVGNGMCVHDHGASGGVALTSYASLAGGSNHKPEARCYLGSHNHASTGGAAPAAPTIPTSTPTSTSTSPATSLTVGTTARKAPRGTPASTLIGIRASINETIQGQVEELTDAGVQLDEVDRNAIGHLEVLRKHLRAGMSAKDLAETRANIKHWGKVLKDEVQKQLKEAQQAAEDEQARMDRQFRDVTEAAVLRPFDKETQAHIAAFEKDTELALRGMRKSFEAQMSAFDEETRRGLEARAAPGETGDEAALRQFQEQRQAESDAKAMAAAQASGDVEQIRQLELDRQERALELAARQSRDAANKAAEESQRNYQQQRDTQRAALEEQEGDREQAYQDDRAKTLAQYQEMRDDQRTHLQDDLDDWSRWLSEKRKTWVEFLTYLSTHGFVVPSDWFKNTDDDVEVRKLFDAGVRLNTTLTGPQHFALGGRVPGRYLGREDTVMARVTPGERVLDREFNARLEEAVFGGRAGGPTVVLHNPTFVGAPTRDAARAWAPAIADELDRQIGYRNGVA